MNALTHGVGHHAAPAKHVLLGLHIGCRRGPTQYQENPTLSIAVTELLEPFEAEKYWEARRRSRYRIGE